MMITVTKAESLTAQEWEFAVLESRSQGELLIVLDYQRAATRPSTRHKFQWVNVYNRHGRQGDPAGTATIPLEVEAEARAQVVARLVVTPIYY